MAIRRIVDRCCHTIFPSSSKRIRVEKIFYLNYSGFDRTISLLDGINLSPGSGSVWKKAFEMQLAEQTLFNNMANSFANFIIRIIGSFQL
jgi:hypothetical protein